VTEWWRDAVVYQVYPRSFADADGDGIGDLPGITGRLPKLAELGVDAVWLSPFYPSPQNDAGYDVSDYRDVEPIFGTLDDADDLIATAHGLGLKVVVDIVPNHTSSEHRWFQAALAAGPGSPERGRYHFRDGAGPDGSEPPNNWRSVFGGNAWTRVREADGSPGQWYLHMFDSTQPDVNWDNPDVHEEFAETLRFWLDRGADGFRIDVAHAMVKQADLPDWAEDDSPMGGTAEITEDRRPPMWDQEGVHEIYREWRKIVDSYDGDRMLVAEAWVTPYERLARYTRADELHQAFNFDHCVSPWRAADQREVITTSVDGSAAVGAPATWVLSNHDIVRHASRFGYPPASRGLGGIGPADEQPDAVLGLRRARAATLLMLALPGSAYLYQGEELGLPEHTTLPGHVRQDPAWFRTNEQETGRDGCRVPIPWEADAPGFGFGPTGSTWLPQPEVYGELARDRQEGVSGSTLEMYKAALRLRRELGLGRGDAVDWVEEHCGEQSLGLRRGGLLVLVNFDGPALTLPEGAEVVLASGPLGADGTVPSDTTVWVR
jgi:alpha-glucosidase